MNNYTLIEQISFITGISAQSEHFDTLTIQPSSKTLTSTTLLHFEHFSDIVRPHFLQL